MTLELHSLNYLYACQLDNLQVNEGKPIKLQNLALALFKTESGKVWAIENSCPHIGAPLDNGLVEKETITCLFHNWCFNLQTGSSTNCPGVKVKTYPVKIQNSAEVWVGL